LLEQTPTSESRAIVSRERFGIGLGFIGMCMFAGTLPATRLAVLGFDPLFLTAARVSIAGLAGALVLIMTRRRVPPRALWPVFFAAASCSVLGFPLSAAFAMVTLPAAHGGVVLGIIPLVTAAAAAIFAHERPSAGFWFASAAGSLIVLTYVYRQSGGSGFSAGDLFLSVTVVSGALAYTLSGRLSLLMPGWEVISWQVVIGLPFALIATLALWPHDITNVPISSWAGLAYVGLVSQYTAFFVFNAAMARSGIARVGQIMLLQPFVIVLMALPANHEPLRLETLLFAAAVVAIVFVGQRMRVKRAHAATAQSENR
jgi:drug/metabolite transporter (DMT)-like permease